MEPTKRTDNVAALHQRRRGSLAPYDRWGRWGRVMSRLAYWLAYRDWAYGRRWRRLSALWPELAMLVAIQNESLLASNTFSWVYDPEEDDVPEGLLDEIGELIERAPAPCGLDDYLVRASRLTAMPGDEDKGLTLVQAEATLPRRRAVETRTVSGDRYYDWKHGQGRQALREMLKALQPQPSFPVTLIRIVVNGAAVARAMS